MGMIRLDLAVIGEGARNASSLANAFDGTDGVAGAAADACGHGGLAGTIRDFESTWSHRRDEFAEQLDTVASALVAVHDAFTTLDRDLASEG
ncbi:hypothetical protein [Agromyces lapidis]|uniref:WXG100 family type VII secretion target n=1 Tax=Agromyces lapidis TaxID=279574 RepID=A0ABV5SQ60_9MICO|nr:hypothetical protein [Agromyces lapidis]